MEMRIIEYPIFNSETLFNLSEKMQISKKYCSSKLFITLSLLENSLIPLKFINKFSTPNLYH